MSWLDRNGVNVVNIPKVMLGLMICILGWRLDHLVREFGWHGVGGF